MEKIMRKAAHAVQGYPTTDGAGVSLIRVLGNATAATFDPFLMLDSFDTEDYEAYRRGFPMHPHRGIETISFLAQGKMEHRDTMGFSDTVTDGEVQYMTAGSGVEHEERLPKAERMCGLQLWLNLPAAEKMAKPAYTAIKRADIEESPVEGGRLRLLLGSYEGHQGVKSRHLPMDYYDIILAPGAKITLDTERTRSCMVFTLKGAARVAGEEIPEKTAVKLSEGDAVELAALDAPIEIMFMSSVALGEPIHWGGPIVMASREDLEKSFDELRRGTFLKDEMEV